MPIELQHLLKAADGELVGKVRLQKTVYLLDQIGMGSGFSYEYHHYGPYSAELARATDDSVAFDEVEEDTRRRADGVAYSVFRLPKNVDVNARYLGGLPFSEAVQALRLMQDRDATVLELASTIHWLTSVEGIENWRRELVRRKGVKTGGDRVEQAVALLDELGIPVAAMA